MIKFVLQIGDFNEEPGPKLPARLDVNTALCLDFFWLLFHPAMFVHMARHTNNYARRTQTNGTPDDKWVETNEWEMRAFVGINILMGINQMPEYDMYWSSDTFLGNIGIQNVMTCNRFQKLCQYFHVSDRVLKPPCASPNMTDCTRCSTL